MENAPRLAESARDQKTDFSAGTFSPLPASSELLSTVFHSDAFWPPATTISRMLLSTPSSSSKLEAENDYKSLCEDNGKKETVGCQHFAAKMKSLNQAILDPKVQPVTIAKLPTETANHPSLLAKLGEFWRDATFVKDVKSLQELKKLSDENDAQASRFSRSCAGDEKKSVPAKAIMIQFENGHIQHNYPMKMELNTESYWTVTLAQGADFWPRNLREVDGKILYTDKEGKESPVRIYQIQSEAVNINPPIDASKSSSCRTFSYLPAEYNSPAPSIKRSRPGARSSGTQ